MSNILDFNIEIPKWFITFIPSVPLEKWLFRISNEFRNYMVQPDITPFKTWTLRRSIWVSMNTNKKWFFVWPNVMANNPLPYAIIQENWWIIKAKWNWYLCFKIW
jgi:hypothetical protein